MLGLNHEDGGVLEFLLVLLGTLFGFASPVVAKAAVSFWQDLRNWHRVMSTIA
jgi:hypothetical protein